MTHSSLDSSLARDADARSGQASAPWRSRIVRHADVAPSELAAHPLNFRRHPRSQADALAAAIDTVGVVQSVIVSERTGRILDGHLRAELALARGEPSLPAAFVDVDEDEERLILATFDPIGALAVTDDAALAALLDSLAPTADGLADLLASLRPAHPIVAREDPGPQVDRAEELRVKWGTDRGQLWEIGRHRLLCGDATSAEDVARLMGGEQAALCFMSPPYNGRTHIYSGARRQNRLLYHDNSKDDMPEAEYVAMVQGAIHNALAVTLDGFVCVNLGYNANARGSYLACMAPFADCLWETVVWRKHGTPVSQGLSRDCEWVFVLGTGAHGHLNEPFETVSNVWEISSVGASDWETHRAAFPVALPLRAITLAMRRKRALSVVLDLFCGTGTTVVAADSAGHAAYAMEISPEYVAVSLERLAGMDLTPRLVD